MSQVVFSPENLARFEKCIAQYEVRKSALLPVLWLAQEQFGFLSTEVMDYVATLLDMPPVQVYEAVTFYVMFRKKDLGKYCLQVCVNVTCGMMGSDALVKVIKDELGLSPGGVTSDSLFSYVPVQCLGSCDTAPVLQVNDEYFEKMTPALMKEVIQRLRQGQFPEEWTHSQGVAQ